MIALLFLLTAASPIDELCDLAGRLAARSYLAGEDNARRSALYREVAPNRMTHELAESMIDVGRMAASARYAQAAGRSICHRQMSMVR